MFKFIICVRVVFYVFVSFFSPYLIRTLHFVRQTFACPPTFRLFACQNPTSQGGGRKGLPKSFLNRFTQVYVDTLTDADLEFIAQSMFPSLDAVLLRRMIAFNARLHSDIMSKGLYGRR